MNLIISLYLYYHLTATDNIGFFPALQNFESPTVNEVINIIVNLNSAVDHNEIKAKLLKEVVVLISKRLTHIFAVSLKTVVVSIDLKVAKVLALPVFSTITDQFPFNHVSPGKVSVYKSY